MLLSGPEPTADADADDGDDQVRLREPEGSHRPSVEDEQALADVVRARQLRESHRAALAVARGNAVPLRPARRPRPASARGAA
ncbi:hypothetical protein [Kitasatospora sp. NPDC088351]|uniref:hypothetical protein n=1 Tax=Kitasatospora sp. NPDC088351 TaxID=3155180 RepID=UPI003442F959